VGIGILRLRQPNPDVEFVKERGEKIVIDHWERSTPMWLTPVERVAGPFPRYGVVRELYVGDSSVSAQEVEVWRRFPKLRNLLLSDVQGAGAALKDLKLPVVDWVEIEGDCVTDEGLMFLGSSPILGRLFVKSKCVRGDFLASLDCWHFLHVLSLEGCQTGDDELAPLEKAVELQELYLQETMISDAGLEKLESLPKLYKLNVRDTQVTPAGVRRFVEKRPDVGLLHNVRERLTDDETRKL
jgi:hypothetical protein